MDIFPAFSLMCVQAKICQSCEAPCAACKGGGFLMENESLISLRLWLDPKTILNEPIYCQQTRQLGLVLEHAKIYNHIESWITTHIILIYLYLFKFPHWHLNFGWSTSSYLPGIWKPKKGSATSCTLCESPKVLLGHGSRVIRGWEMVSKFRGSNRIWLVPQCWLFAYDVAIAMGQLQSKCSTRKLKMNYIVMNVMKKRSRSMTLLSETHENIFFCDGFKSSAW